MAGRILTINSGSSTVKFSIYEADPNEKLVLSGSLDGKSMRAKDADSRSLFEEPASLDDREAAITLLFSKLPLDGVTAVGHRIVHGGPRNSEPKLVNTELIAELKRIIPLAPNHMPDAISSLETAMRILPKCPNVACFDTAFHRRMPRTAQHFGIPRDLVDRGVVRYGFHGLSYEFITRELARENALPARLVIAHLGNGASMAAIRDGVSVDTSMGLTPTGGFPMSSRTGDLDPGVLLYLLRAEQWSVEQVSEMVTRGGGLKALAGTPDMQELLARAGTDANAEEAVAVFCYNIRKFLGSYMAVLGGLDALVFTGGIGEHAAPVRARICEGLGELGIQLDASLNAGNRPVISSGSSRVLVRVMPTNEELMIVRHTMSAAYKLS